MRAAPRSSVPTMPDGLYERDALLWSEQQADLLRRTATGERLNASIDWPNVIEEVLDVGRAELHACESLLEQAIVHLLKLAAAPGHPSTHHWRVELLAFLAGARRRHAPSMTQRIDLQSVYHDARRQARAALADAPVSPAWPDQCPFTITDLLDRTADIAALTMRLA